MEHSATQLCWPCAALVWALGAPVQAQEPARSTPAPITIGQAIDLALARHPSLQARQALAEAAAAGTGLARTGYLPQVDLSLQLNRATGNVLPGSLFSMPGIPAISGPPAEARFDGGAFGSQLGAGAAWDVLGLPQRMALVDEALQGEQQVRGGTAAQRLAVAFAAGDAFLGSVGGGETVKAAAASVERARLFVVMVKALTDQQLRPGADLSRALAEQALAGVQLIRAEQAQALAGIELAQTLGSAGSKFVVSPGRLLESPAAGPGGDHPPSRHPLLMEADAALEAARARKHATGLQYLPRLDLVAALWARGSGLGPGGQGTAYGLVPDTPNWAAGIVLSWPALGPLIVRARARSAEAQVRLQGARREEIAQAIRSQIDAAQALLDSALRIARQTPIALDAARAAERQATARYRAGLTQVTEVAEAQRLLAQSESEDAVARLQIHRARLLLSRAIGDMGPFLSEVSGTDRLER